ncbi:MAG: ATP-binding protein [Myxococcota bacterium]
MHETIVGSSALVAYACGVVDAFIAFNHDPNDAETDHIWQGFAPNIQAVRREVARSVYDPRRQERFAVHQALLERWLTEPPSGLVRLAELAALFQLDALDVGLLILAGAPALHAAVGELYAHVRRDITHTGPSVGLLCRLMALGDQATYELLTARCQYDASLRRHRLLIVEPRQRRDDSPERNLVNRRVQVADRVLAFLSSHNTEGRPSAVDESLAAVCVRLEPHVELDTLSVPETCRTELLHAARGRDLPLVLRGSAQAAKGEVAQALALLLGRGLLTTDLSAMLDNPAHLEVLLANLFREARLGGDLVYLSAERMPEQVPPGVLLVLERILTREVFVLGGNTWPGWFLALSAPWTSIAVPLPDPEQRLAIWRDALDPERRPVDAASLEAIARRYEMSAEQIRVAADEARRRAQLRRRRRLELLDLDQACRTHFAHQLSDLAQVMPPSGFTAEALILPEPEKQKFEEILLFAQEHEAIYAEWGFADKFPYGRGLSVLFYGPPGTGKTMAATIIASTLGLDLFRVDISRITSRYVGETEKNLSRIFDEAERGRVMLLFDEADSLFTKRTDVKSSTDRYANLEVTYLLQRMESFEGVTVLTTNAEHHIDDAFKRRIRYRVYYPMPDPETRARLWQSMLPHQAPRRPDIPWGLLGQHFELSGGHIKQAVLRAAFYARSDTCPIGLTHLLRAAQTECRELGMLVTNQVPKPLKRALEAEHKSST